MRAWWWEWRLRHRYLRLLRRAARRGELMIYRIDTQSYESARNPRASTRTDQ